MEWTDEGIVLSTRRHGESSAVVTLLTRAHGRHAGLAHGGASRRARGLFQTGNRLQAVWRARLAEHLGHYSCELLESHAATLLDDPLRLSALTAAAAVADAALPEREPHARIYEGLRALLEALAASPAGRIAGWAEDYVRWELDLLADLGFGLDLTRCAATGSPEDLIYVSPKSGRAVSAAAGEPYRDQLLPLPAFLTRPAGAGAPPDAGALLAGLRLTGFFLERHLLAHAPGHAVGHASGHAAPAGQAAAARDRFVQRLRTAAAAGT